MSTLTQNGINFTLNGDSIGSVGGGKYTDTSNFNTTTRKYNDNQNKLNNLGVAVSVNGVEIDWNSAQFANAVAAITEVPDAGEVQSANSSITTTGELISIVAKQQKQIDTLITMVKGLYASLVS